jgi:hypothetical protein
MVRHGGKIERTVVAPVENDDTLLKEIHIVTFPDQAAFDAYRRDPALAGVAHLRERAVVATEVMIGEAGPDYHDAL